MRSFPFPFRRRALPPSLPLTLLLLALLPAGARAAAAPSPEEAAVLALFEKRCAECHKSDESPVLSAETNLRELRGDPKYVTPGKAETSELFTKITLPLESRKRMPKSKGKEGEKDFRAHLTPEEQEVVKQWIEGGTAVAGAAGRKFITDDSVAALVEADITALDEKTQPFTRYLTLTNLYNAVDAAGKPLIADADLELYRGAVNKMINSLSRKTKISRTVPIDPEKTVFRVDLRHYGWTAALWDRVTSFYPFAVHTDRGADKEAMELSGSAVPRVRADWFVFAVAQPPLYYEALEMPGLDGSEGADTALEKTLGVDVPKMLASGKGVRSGFEISGVSQGNRMIERFPQSGGASYWKSYDFDKSRKDQPGGDLFLAPLGPPGMGLTGNADHEFQHDGGEIVFTLPNGLKGFVLTNHNGTLLSRAPIDIVTDKSRKDSSIISGISCMSCHREGMFPAPKDEIAAVAGKAFKKGKEREKLLQLYDQGRIEKALDEDKKNFLVALGLCGVDNSGKDEPVRALYDHFNSPVTAFMIASEFGRDSADFLKDMANDEDEAVRVLASKLERGLTIPRQIFMASTFKQVVTALDLGTIPPFTPAPFEEYGGTKVKVAGVTTFASATEDDHFINALGMEFAPVTVGDERVLFCVHETRAGDYRAFVKDKDAAQAFELLGIESSDAFENPGFKHTKQTAEHPVVNVSWREAVAFTQWLTDKDRGAGKITARQSYRLPTDREWSAAALLEEDGENGTPEDRDGQVEAEFPWQDNFPPTSDEETSQGNYADSAFNTAFKVKDGLAELDDGFAETGPVMSTDANANGLFDLGGNVWEWTLDTMTSADDDEVDYESDEPRALRGGAWDSYEETDLLSSKRLPSAPTDVDNKTGFRVVLVE